MKPKKKVRPRRVSRSPFTHLWPELAQMPPLDHWPKRPASFDPDQSHVLGWMAELCGGDIKIAGKIFEAARHKQIIKYNRETRLWCGCKGGQP